MKNAVLCFTAAAFCTAVLFSGCSEEAAQPDPRDKAMERAQMVQIAKDAYVYGYPLVLMEITKRSMTNPLPGSGNVPINQIRHIRTLADDQFRDFVRPNADTFYSFAWLDLSKEPLLFEIPDTGGRYAAFPLFNAWTDVFASPGKRTTGAGAQKFAVTGPRWNGELPEGFEEYRSSTNLVWWMCRIQVNSRQDGETNVKKIQDAIKLYPLSSYGKKYSAPKGRADDTLPYKTPLEQIASMSISDFFNTLNQLLVNNPPYPADAPVLDKILDLGVAPGMRFDITSFDIDTQESFKEIPAWFKNYSEGQKSEIAQNGWTYRYGLGDYKANYALRAKMAYMGLGASLDADLVYIYSDTDYDGEKYDGKKNYVLHFGKDEMPPVNAFWSICAYDGAGFFVKNAAARYSLGSKDSLKFNKDGSLDIYIQKDNPGKEKQSNWLPVPESGFNLLLRCYWPKEGILEGRWKTPSVNKAR